jgi:hypothetical protein
MFVTNGGLAANLTRDDEPRKQAKCRSATPTRGKCCTQARLAICRGTGRLIEEGLASIESSRPARHGPVVDVVRYNPAAEAV